MSPSACLRAYGRTGASAVLFFFSSRRRHTRSCCDWSSDVCSSDLSESLDLLHVHYAIPHSVSALLARSMAAPRGLPFITTLHGTDITLVGSNRSYLPITKFSIKQSDGVTSISRYLLGKTLKEFDIKR